LVEKKKEVDEGPEVIWNPEETIKLE